MGGNKVLSVLLLHYISDPPWLSRGIFPIYKSQKFLAEPVRNSGISPSILLTFTYVILWNSFNSRTTTTTKGAQNTRVYLSRMIVFKFSKHARCAVVTQPYTSHVDCTCVQNKVYINYGSTLKMMIWAHVSFS